MTVDATGQLSYQVTQGAAIRFSAPIAAVAAVSQRYGVVMAAREGFAVVDLEGGIARAFQPEGKLRPIYANVNERLCAMMRGETPKEEGVSWNTRVFANSVRKEGENLFVLCFDRILSLSPCDLESRFTSNVETGNLLEALQWGLRHASELRQRSRNAGPESDEKLGYFSFLNRISGVLVRFAEQSDFPAKLTWGVCCDVMTRLDRGDVLLLPLRSIAQQANQMASLLASLQQYIFAGRVPSLPADILPDLVHAAGNRFRLERAFLSMQFDETPAVMEFFAGEGLLLAHAALAGRFTGSYVRMLPPVMDRIIAGNVSEYFAEYPAVLSETEIQSRGMAAGTAGLHGLLLFLLYVSVTGVSLTGVSLNSLARCANQSESFGYLAGKLGGLAGDGSFVVWLCFFALSLRVMGGGEDEEYERVVVENEGFRALSAQRDLQIVRCLARMLGEGGEVDGDEGGEKGEKAIDGDKDAKTIDKAIDKAIDTKGDKDAKTIDKTIDGDKDDKTIDKVNKDTKDADKPTKNDHTPAISLSPTDRTAALALCWLYLQSCPSTPLPPPLLSLAYAFLLQHTSALPRESLSPILLRFPPSPHDRPAVIEGLVAHGCLAETLPLLETSPAELASLFLRLARADETPTIWSLWETSLARVETPAILTRSSSNTLSTETPTWREFAPISSRFENPSFSGTTKKPPIISSSWPRVITRSPWTSFPRGDASSISVASSSRGKLPRCR